MLPDEEPEDELEPDDEPEDELDPDDEPEEELEPDDEPDEPEDDPEEEDADPEDEPVASASDPDEDPVPVGPALEELLQPAAIPAADVPIPTTTMTWNSFLVAFKASLSLRQFTSVQLSNRTAPSWRMHRASNRTKIPTRTPTPTTNPCCPRRIPKWTPRRIPTSWAQSSSCWSTQPSRW
jgi:hypothetical protein